MFRAQGSSKRFFRPGVEQPGRRLYGLPMDIINYGGTAAGNSAKVLRRRFLSQPGQIAGAGY